MNVINIYTDPVIPSLLKAHERKRLNQQSPTCLIWVDPWIKIEYPTWEVRELDYGVSSFETSIFLSAKFNA